MEDIVVECDINSQYNSLLQQYLYNENIYNEGKIWEGIKSGISKIWNFIKEFFKWLKKQILKFINFIKRLFKKKTKTADQIVVESLSTIKTESNNDVVDNVQTTNESKQKFDIFFKKFLIEISKDNTTLTFTRMTGKYKINGKDESNVTTNIPNAQPQPGTFYGDPCYILEMISNPKNASNVLNAIIQLCDLYKQSIISENDAIKIAYSIKSEMDRMRSESYDVNKVYTVTYSSILDFQSKLSSVSSIIEDIHLDDNLSNTLVESFKDVIDQLTILQLSMNSLNREMLSMWIVDGVYKDIVSNVNDLSTIIKKFIKFGIPAKYICKNILILSSKELTGESNPALGQSRIVLFPMDKSIVYKIAVSGFGINANREETKITDIIKSYQGWETIISPILDNHENIICTMHRCKTFNKEIKNNNPVKIFEKKLEEFYLQDEKHWNFPYELSSDLNESNIGIDPSSKEIVLIDYGLMNRRKPRKTFEEVKNPKDRVTRSTYNDLARQYGFPEKPGDPNDLVTI